MISKLLSIENLLLLLVVLVTLFCVSFLVSTGSPNRTKLSTPHYSPMHMNAVCSDLMIRNSQSLLKFFSKYTEDESVSFHILNNALSKNIPIYLFFSLAYNESRYKVNAISKRNIGGSRDYGLFQLNSRTYRRYPKRRLLDLSTNCILAGDHLRRNYITHKNWYLALIAYNNGNVKRIPKRTYRHVVNILIYADMIKEDFYNFYKDFK